jgi:hypothetical protein
MIPLNDRIEVAVRGPPMLIRSIRNKRLRLRKKKTRGPGRQPLLAPWRQGTEHGSKLSILLLEHNVNSRRQPGQP